MALLGTRGLPATYGGFETFYENLGPRLVDLGYDVTVYNRASVVGHNEAGSYRNLRVVELPSLNTKHLGTITHTALSVLHALFKRYDVVYICGVGNASLAWVPRLTGARVVINVDSADWRRAKWGRLASRYLKSMERLAGITANAVVVDNEAIRSHYVADYGMDPVFIPYGGNITRTRATDELEFWGLTPDRYILWVGRLEPETAVEELMAAFGSIEADGFKLAVVGDAPFAVDYKARLQSLASPEVVFTGKQYGPAYQQLSCHAFAYVQTSPTSGTSPALLDQMAFGNAVIARGTAANSEVVGSAGLVYPPGDPVGGLARALRSLLDDQDLRERLRSLAVERIRTTYSWDRVVSDYDTLFHKLARRERAIVAD